MPDKFNILIIDDEEGIRDSCSQLLERRGHNVDTAENGEEGLELLNKSGFDIVILDLKMPGIGGIEVLNRIKEDNPEIIVIVITGYATVESAVEAMKLGAYDFLPKPFTPDELNVTIKRAEEKMKLQLKNLYLQEELNSSLDMDEIIGESKSIVKLKQMIRKVAPTDSTVLITGESGTGKELVARAIHRYSQRNDKPFITVDCGSIVPNLFESELFGHVKGSFTGATKDKRGKLELADNGTIFFDEIANIDTNIQGKLLRAIQEKEITKVGGTETIKVDCRIISATNKDLLSAIDEGTFREDLYYRLSVIPIHIPPLRDRKQDIPVLVRYFLKKYNNKKGKDIQSISEKAMEKLMNYKWPGNVRELKNIIERAVVLSTGREIKQDVLFTQPENSKKKNLEPALESAEKNHIINILNRCDWNKTEAAELLEIDRKTLYRKIKKYNIQEGHNTP